MTWRLCQPLVNPYETMFEEMSPIPQDYLTSAYCFFLIYINLLFCLLFFWLYSWFTTSLAHVNWFWAMGDTLERPARRIKSYRDSLTASKTDFRLGFHLSEQIDLWLEPNVFNALSVSIPETRQRAGPSKNNQGGASHNSSFEFLLKSFMERARYEWHHISAGLFLESLCVSAMMH